MSQKRNPYAFQIFRSGTSAESRRVSIIAFIYLLICGLAMIWPIYTIANRVYPIILGMPFSMFWIAFWIVMTFIGLIFLYRYEFGR